MRCSAELDIVTASLHSSLRQPREKITERLLMVIRNPNVDVIGHPTGRLLPDREGADLDMDAVLEAARESGVALEINAHPARLDLEDVYARRAVEMGIRLAINTDAHSQSDLELLHFGVATARRGWVEPQHVLNTWEPEALVAWLKARGNHQADKNIELYPDETLACGSDLAPRCHDLGQCVCCATRGRAVDGSVHLQWIALLAGRAADPAIYQPVQENAHD